jgi:hypothetical protein
MTDDRFQLTKRWGIRKLKEAGPGAWAIQYLGMDWLRVIEFLPPTDGNSASMDSEMRKFAAEITDEFDKLRGALALIRGWAAAYPLSIFPEPDLEKAAVLLAAGGMTLDAVSASAIRHAVESLIDLAEGALSA